MAKRAVSAAGAPHIDPVLTGSRIMAHMRKKKIHAKQVADEVRTTTAVVYAWTRGSAIPGMQNMARLAICLGCKIDDLIVMEEDEDGKSTDVNN